MADTTELIERGNERAKVESWRLHVLIEAPADGLRAKVDKAVRECPTGAISLEE